MVFWLGGVESRIADNGESQHVTYNSDSLYNLRACSPENVEPYIGDGGKLVVEYVDVGFDFSQNARRVLRNVHTSQCSVALLLCVS